jgi:broad specificity phosphatase PhoE
MKSIRVLLAAACLVAFAGAASAADPVIFVVRHAEKAPTGSSQPAAPHSHTMMADDPPLSPAGQARARKLAETLRSAGIRTIYATEYLRTRQTAAPLARALRLQPIMARAKDTDTLLQQLRLAKGNVLVVSHADTIPAILKGLGVKEVVTIGDNEWDSLFVVIRPASGEPTFVHLHY